MNVPYKCHIFVCVNDRKGEAKSCADGGNAETRKKLKEEAKKRWPSGEVRVSQSLCMGLCSKGPNVVLYPQNLWYSGVSPADVGRILDDVQKLLQKP